MIKIALVTVNFNDLKDTLELLESIKKLDISGLDFKFIIVDATPNDWIDDHIKEKPVYLETLQSGKNRGFSGNYNVGIRFAKAWGADYIAIINNDTIISDVGLLRELIKVFTEHSDAWVVSPKIYFAPGYEFFKDRYKKSEEGKILWYAGGDFDWGNIRSVHRGIDEVDTGKFDAIENTGFVTGCFLMFKSDILGKVGYFDESLYAYFEDNDWQERILRAGGKLYYCGQTSIFHKVSRTIGIGSEETDYLLTRNRLYFTFKYASFWTKFAVVREMVRQLFIGRRIQRKAIFDFLKGIKGSGRNERERGGKYEYPVRLSILISNYKTAGLTQKLLESIFKKGSGFDERSDEVIVLDDASGDNLKDIEQRYPLVRFLENKTNQGFVASYNRMFDYARGEYFLMLNSDVEVKSGSISYIIKNNAAFDDKAVLAGKLIFPDGGDQDSCFRLPTVWGAFKEYFLRIKGSYFMFRPEESEPKKVEGAVMAAFFIPRTIFNKIGYLNEKLFMYFEDIDYCRRLKKAEIPVYYCPEAVFIHYHGVSSQIAGGMTKQLIESSKAYHGAFNYYLLTLVLWLGQKINNIRLNA